MKMPFLLCVAGLLLSPTMGRTDVWDTTTPSDDGPATSNELVHGSDQIHDLGARPGPVADEDWFRIGQKPRSSYEIVVDGTGGGVGATDKLQRVNSTGMTLQSSVAVTPALNYSRTLRWMNTTGSSVDDQFLKVGSANCQTTCTAADGYRIRAMETTVYVARFNNTASQVTILLAQNASENRVSGTAFYWNPAGGLIGQSALAIPPKGIAVINTSTVAGNNSGSITIAHDAPYGQLNTKSIALEPSTGFSFDTHGMYRGF